jgi:hypothetical protein
LGASEHWGFNVPVLFKAGGTMGKNGNPGQTGSGGGDRGGSKSGYSPNDDRAIVKNPNNPAHEADRVNREKQAGGG